jgi:capsid protein
MIAAAARPWSMPYNIAACDSSSYNYSSGRLDHKTYFKAINVDRSSGELTVVDRLFIAYHAEASLRGIVPVEAGEIESWDWAWFWDGDEHVDPVKEANAQKIRLEIGTTTYAEEFAREGKDYETQFVQQAREQGMRRRLGLPVQSAAPAAAPAAEKVAAAFADEEEGDDDA